MNTAALCAPELWLKADKRFWNITSQEVDQTIDISEIKCIEAEAGVIATLLQEPTKILFSPQMTFHHFAEKQNAYIYYAIGQLVKRGLEKVDAYDIINILNAVPSTKKYTDVLTPEALTELFGVAPLIARETVSEYQLLVEQIMDAAFRRDAFKKLRECEALCLRMNDNESIQTRIYNEVESLIRSYQSLDDLHPLGDSLDTIWQSIANGQDSDDFIEFPFPTLNEYVKISRTNCIIFSAREKRGKSLMLLTLAVDLIRKGKRVLVIDTELDTKLYVMRLLSHITGIEFVRIQDGNYSAEESEQLERARKWIKMQNFCHVYAPGIDEDSLLSMVKAYKHKYGLDAVILDYLKNNSYSYDAYETSSRLGRLTDCLKNTIAGEENLFVLTAVQATASGAIADSAKIIRNCSTMIHLERKEQSQIDADGGPQFGNMTIKVTANRNGMIMGDEDPGISLTLDGNRCRFYESMQPPDNTPY